jgi:hypothetical protein
LDDQPEGKEIVKRSFEREEQLSLQHRDYLASQELCEKLQLEETLALSRHERDETNASETLDMKIKSEKDDDQSWTKQESKRRNHKKGKRLPKWTKK